MVGESLFLSDVPQIGSIEINSDSSIQKLLATRTPIQIFPESLTLILGGSNLNR